MRNVWHHVYSCIITLASPFVWLYFWIRSFRSDPAYRGHLAERFMRDHRPLPAPVDLWLHAASVGELHAVAPLIQSLSQYYPGQRWLITCLTPSGRARAAVLFASLAPQICYLPLDMSHLMRHFVSRYAPKVALIMEVELWPNLLAALAEHEVPTFLLNARLSQERLYTYQRCRSLVLPCLQSFRHILVSAEADARRFRSLGAHHVELVGNIKFDIPLDRALYQRGQAWKSHWSGRIVLMCASSHEGEEEACVRALLGHPDYDPVRFLLLMVPRHPTRAPAIAEMLTRLGISFVLRSSGYLPSEKEAVWLGDSLGEMVAYYSAADYVVMGGSFMPIGGHNFIEALLCDLPLIVGPYMFHFEEETRAACAAGAMLQLNSWPEVIDQLMLWADNPSDVLAIRHAAQRFLYSAQGAQERTIAILAQSLDPLFIPETIV